jgi:hypothetical protein
MKKIILYSFIFLFHIENTYAAGNEATLCRRNEETLFNCETAKKKIISLCEMKSEQASYLEYRYGNSEQLDFSYKAEANSPNKFFQGTSHGGQVSTSLIWFSNGPYTYTLFSPDWGLDGVAVLKDNKRLTKQNCSLKSSGEIGIKNRWIEERSEDEAREILLKLLY